MTPGASAKNNSRPPIARRGRTATKSAITPIPPSHCVSERQKKIPRPKAVKSTITVAPVVVNPDIDSKSASMNPMPAHM